MSMTCYIAHTYVVSDGGSAYYELGFDNEMRPNIVITESFIDDFAEPTARKELINDAFDANYTWREGDQYAYYSSDPWEDEHPYTMADEIESTSWMYGGEGKREFNKFFKTVEKMKDIKYVLLATDATRPSDNYGEYWYDALICDFYKKNLVKIEWRGAPNTERETYSDGSIFGEEEAEEIIEMLNQNGIDQFDTGDFELDGVLQGRVSVFPILQSSKVPNNNQCIHILPAQKKQTEHVKKAGDEENSEGDNQNEKLKEDAKVSSENKSALRITMKEALSHFPTGISAGSNTHIVGLKSDGTVVASKIFECDYMDLGWDQIDIGDWKDIIMISTSAAHTVGLKSDGTVVSTSLTEEESYGQTAVEDWSDIVMISAADSHTVGLRSDGTVVSTSITDEEEDCGQTAVEDWSDIIMISASAYHTVGLKSDGTVVSTAITDDDWDYGQTEVEDWKDIVMISSNEFNTVGLKSDGTVMVVGSNEYWQTEVEDWENIVAVSSGVEHTVGLKADGTVIGIGGDPIYAEERSELADWENIITVVAGYGYNLGLRSDGTLVFAAMDSSIDEKLINFDDWNDIGNPALKR